MQIFLADQLRVTLLSILLGLGLGALYDIVRIFRTLLGVVYVNRFTDKLKKIKLPLIINPLLRQGKQRRIAENIIKALKDMPILPQGDMKIAWEIAKDKTYLERVTEAYDRIEELVSYYLAATQLLGYAYAFLGEESSYEDVFCPCPELLDNELLNRLVNAEAIYVEDIEDAWYKNPEQYMLQIKDASQKLFSHKENDVIELEISGQKLLEAL